MRFFANGMKIIWNGSYLYFECFRTLGRTLLPENRTPVEKMDKKRLFFEGFPNNQRCYGNDNNFKL